LHVDERITRREKVHDQAVAAIARAREVADGMRDLEGATDQIAAGSHMLGPRHDDIAEHHIRARFEALQPTLFYQVAAEPTEPKAGIVVAKTRSGNEAAQPDIGTTGRISVAVFQAKIDHPADGQEIQVSIRKQCRYHDLVQNIQRCESYRVAHHGQIEERLNLAAAEQCPRPLVLSSRVLFCWMR